jgi:hypothetical protein
MVRSLKIAKDSIATRTIDRFHAGHYWAPRLLLVAAPQYSVAAG